MSEAEHSILVAGRVSVRRRNLTIAEGNRLKEINSVSAIELGPLTLRSALAVARIVFCVLRRP